MSTLSRRQELIWIEDELHPSLPVNNVITCLRIYGQLDIPLLVKSFGFLCQQNPALRLCSYTDQNRRRNYRVLDEIKPLQVSDFSLLPNGNEHHKAWLDKYVRTCFVDDELLYDAHLIVKAADEYHLYLNQHHSITDGMSCNLIYEQLSSIYECLSSGESIDYKLIETDAFMEAMEAEQVYFQSEKFDETEQFWQQHFANPVPPVQFFGQSTYHKTAKTFRYKHVLTDEMNQLLKQNALGCSEALLFTAVTFAFMRIITGNDDLSVGVPLLNRSTEQFSALGMFMDICPNRIHFDLEETLESLLEKLKKEIDHIRPHRGHGLSAKLSGYEVLVNYHTRAPASFVGMPCEFELTTPSNLVESYPDDVPSQYWQGRESLAIQVYSTPTGQTELFFDFNMGVWSDSIFRDLAVEHFDIILKSFLTNPSQMISKLNILTPFEHESLFGVNESAYVVGNEIKTVPELFSRQVHENGGRLAVEFGNESYSYKQLDIRVDDLATQLVMLGVRPNVLVGICVERSIDMLVCLLSVWRAGGAYVPIDPKQPMDRIALILEDANPIVMLTETDLRDNLGEETNRHTICLDDNDFQSPKEKVLFPLIKSEDIAYVIFTSGSTGRPKGVEVKHHGLTTFLQAMSDSPGINIDDKLLSVTTISFDIAALELFLPLIIGASVRLVSYETSINGPLLKEEIDRSDITIFQATPASYRLLIASGWQGNQQIKLLCGGEAMPQELAMALIQRCSSLWNMYGPTETTIWSSVSCIESESAQITIGKAIKGTQMYVLNECLNPVPLGVPGELYISGDGVAKGYYKNQKLTDERFILDPFSGESQLKMYKTGDLVRYNSGLDLEYLGRIDFQVKIRGFRIEIGEIETILGSHDAVKQCVVTTFSDEARELALVAYIKLIGKGPDVGNDIKQYLKNKLPDYMVPAKLVSLDVFPLTPNGKVDRKALPAVDQVDNLIDGGVYVAPRNDFELSLSASWQQVLKVEQVGITDNFFELGGDSLMTVALVQAMECATGIKYEIGDIFANPTIEQLSGLDADNAIKSSNVVPLQLEGERTPLFCLCGIHIYQELADQFVGQSPVYGIYAAQEQDFLEKLLSGEHTNISITDLAHTYFEAICRQQSEGPYQLAGISFGGLLAFETAKLLQQHGKEVASVILFDTILPLAIERDFLNKTKHQVKSVLKNMKKGIGFSNADASAFREQAFIEAMKNYQSSDDRYTGRVILVRAEDTSAWGKGVTFKEDYGWQAFLDTELIIEKVAGDHLSIIKSPNVSVVFERFKEYLV